MRALALLALLTALCAPVAASAPSVDPPVPPPPAAPSAPLPTPPKADRSIFAGAGLLIARPGDVDARQLAALMQATHFTWVAVLVQDGLRPLNADASAWAGPLLERGIQVGGWAVLRTDPEAEAITVADRIKANRLAFLLADAEFEYSRYGDPGRSRRYTAALRALAPNLPAALTSFGRVDGAYGMDWATWRAAGFEFLPQCYLADGDAFAPALAVQAALAIWPRAMIHPLLGLYGGVPASAYTAGLEDGFAVFPGETAQAADLRLLARAAGL